MSRSLEAPTAWQPEHEAMTMHVHSTVVDHSNVARGLWCNELERLEPWILSTARRKDGSVLIRF